MAGSALLGFTAPAAQARGRLVRLGPVGREILAAHAYPPAVALLLGEALALTALLGALLVEEQGQLTLQVHGEDAPLRLMVADWRQGELRGYVSIDLDRRFPAHGGAANLDGLFGNGRMVLTVDGIPGTERHQGIVPLDAPTLAQAATRFFASSEQVPTLVRLAARATDGRADGRTGGVEAGGLLLQRLPDAGHADSGAGAQRFDRQFDDMAVLAASVGDHELTDAALEPQALLWRLFHEQQLRVFRCGELRRGCRCTAGHVRGVLARFPEEERAQMRNDEGRIAVDCEFCARQFLLDC